MIFQGDVKADEKAAQEVDNLISAIGDVTLEKEDFIDAARAAYDELTDNQKDLVENYQTYLNGLLSHIQTLIDRMHLDVDISDMEKLTAWITPAETENSVYFTACHKESFFIKPLRFFSPVYHNSRKTQETLAISLFIKYNKLIYFTYLTRFALCI